MHFHCTAVDLNCTSMHNRMDCKKYDRVVEVEESCRGNSTLHFCSANEKRRHASCCAYFRIAVKFHALVLAMFEHYIQFTYVSPSPLVLDKLSTDIAPEI